MRYTYNELSDDLKTEARKRHPEDYTEWLYVLSGVEIRFSCK